jgi:pyrimidine operon attenuation protein/uracil phosphoribosyltransferase
MNSTESGVVDAGGLHAILDALAGAIQNRKPIEGAPLRLVGIRSRGVPIALRIAERLKEIAGLDVPVGTVDITMYRDDFGQRANWPVLEGTDIPFPVEDAEIILIDDVLFTGRTVRAAIDAICDLGRPSRIGLAVVVDRNGRELPIQPDYIGCRLSAGPDERIEVKIQPVDDGEGIVRVPHRQGA